MKQSEALALVIGTAAARCEITEEDIQEACCVAETIMHKLDAEEEAMGEVLDIAEEWIGHLNHKWNIDSATDYEKAAIALVRIRLGKEV